MALNTLLGSASFAHLLGRPAATSAKRAEEDDDTKKKDDDAKAKGAKADDDGDTDKKKDDDAKASSAKADDDGDDDGDTDKKKSRRAKAADGDDPSDDDDETDAKAMAARRRERARCAAIFASPHAGARPDVAAHLAFGTDMPRAEAVTLLAAVAGGEAAEPRRAGRLAERMDRQTNPDVGTPAEGAAAETPKSIAARMLASAHKARPQ